VPDTDILNLRREKHTASPLQRPTGRCCSCKSLLLILRITWITQIHSDGKMQSL